MIALGSKSYPYLAVAQNFKIPYSQVLRLVEDFERHDPNSPPYTDWRAETWLAYRSEIKRRKEVLGI